MGRCVAGWVGLVPVLSLQRTGGTRLVDGLDCCSEEACYTMVFRVCLADWRLRLCGAYGEFGLNADASKSFFSSIVHRMYALHLQKEETVHAEQITG